MENMNRNKFFTTLGKSTLMLALASALPVNLFSKLSRVSIEKKIKIVIHPSSVKRNNKV
ncbi:MAG: hypothetical protein ACYC4T_12695 [Melioribacteraceae bacterium]